MSPRVLEIFALFKDKYPHVLTINQASAMLKEGGFPGGVSTLRKRSATRDWPPLIRIGSQVRVDREKLIEETARRVASVA
jgi:hypothetical protein